MNSSPSLRNINSNLSYFKFVLPPTAPLRYKTAGFLPSTTVQEVIDKLTELCHFVNFTECGYGLYLPKGNGPTRGRWLENDKPLSDYPLDLEESIELRKKPGFRSNPNMPASTALPLKEGNVLRYSPLTRLWSPCVLRVYNVKLAICTSEHDNNPDIILFANVTKVAEADKKYAFFVAVEDTKTTFRCRNNAETLEWVKVIRETVSNVNPDFLFDVTSQMPRPSPRTPRASRTASFLSLFPLGPREDSPVLTSSQSAPPMETLHLSPPSSPRNSGLSPREERKKYSFLTLRSNKKKSQRDLLKEAKEKEEKKEREREKHEAKGKRSRGATISHHPNFATSSAASSPNLTSSGNTLSLSNSGISSSTNLTSSTGSASSPSTPTRTHHDVGTRVTIVDFPFLDDDDNGIRARSHSTSTTNIPTIPTIQSLLVAKRLSTNEAEIASLREKLQYQTEHNRLIEEKYQKLLMKYSDQASKSMHKLPSPRGDTPTPPFTPTTPPSSNPLSPSSSSPVNPLAPSSSSPSNPLFPSASSPSSLSIVSAPESDLNNSPRTRKSTSMMWRFSRKAYEPELLELKLEIQQLKTDNRLMRIQLERRAERDREVRMSMSNAKSERKRTSPRNRKQLRDDKSMTRLEISRGDSTVDLQEERIRSESASAHNDNAGEDVFLRDNIRSDFTRENSRGDFTRDNSRSDLTSSRSDLVASGELRRDAASASEFEYLQKEMVVLRDRLVEQQALFKQEEAARLEIEMDFRRNQELDEKLLGDIEGVTRILKQSLGDLKERLEVEMDSLELGDSSGEDEDEDENGNGE
eukprot:Phypoly_transcript_02186.p1 GENE.Phypoly_transcript_02186~~Phypoly_transcript_02186.p1  ORF type:complete len:808 (+),score=221.47 Phypoly_transcript_02186:57-2480(+)